MIPPDMQCTWWFDRVPDFLGGVLTPCCQAHDLGGSDLGLFMCVANRAPLAVLTASVMLVGVILGRPVWRCVQEIKARFQR